MRILLAASWILYFARAHLLSTAQQRSNWAPPCKANVRRGVIDAWRALDSCLRLYNYHPRKGVTGARSCRPITGGSGYSLHAYYVDGLFTFWNGLVIGLGIAMDINWDRNPYGRLLVTDMPREMVEAILAIRTNNGKEVWGWGGNYSKNKDAMHWELGCSPVDIATGINWATVRGTLGTTPTPVLTPAPGVQAGRKWPGKPSERGGYHGDGDEFSKHFDDNSRYIQHRLNQVVGPPAEPGSERIPEDGFFGPKTGAKVRIFQRRMGLPVDGVVGPVTWAKLG